MAKIDFRQKLLQIDGKKPLANKQPRLDENGEQVKDEKGNPVMDDPGMLLMDVCSQALLTPYNDEKDVSGDEKHRRYSLAKRIMQTPEGEKTLVKAEEVTLLKTLLPKMYAPLVVGQAFDLLEGESE